MWLEELAWVWLPVVSGIGLLGLWSHLALKAEVRALRTRLEQIENQDRENSPQRRAA